MKLRARRAAWERSSEPRPSRPIPMTDLFALLVAAVLAYVYTMRPQRP